MPLIAAKLEALGLVLPKAVRLPPGIVLPFRLVRVLGSHAYVSGHGPLNPDGTLAPPLGKVGRDLSVEQGYRAAVGRAWRAVNARTGSDGSVIDVCESTARIESLEGYLGRAALVGRDDRAGATMQFRGSSLWSK